MSTETKLTDAEIATGVELLLNRLREIIESNPEISTIHDAFEYYGMQRYSLGKSASDHVVGGSGDLGIDFYSHKDRIFHIGQCKIPEADWLEAHPTQPKSFGPGALNDTRDALRYLLGQSELKPNEQVRRLYALMQTELSDPGFHVTFYILVFGRLNARASDAVSELRASFESKAVSIVLLQMEELVAEFLLGAAHSVEQIQFELRMRKGELLSAQNYCYFLANASDLFKAFMRYGWRLFELNLRFEVKNSAVNGEIISSLSHTKSRKNFHHYNNGLIITAERYSFREGSEASVSFTGAQVVNGLQTLRSIYNAVSEKSVTLEELNAECVVPVKVIRSNDAKFTDAIVRATNNQNPMAQRNLRSNSKEQKVLRKAFTSYTPRWFFQIKEGEWDSLNSEQGRFFEQVVGAKPAEFRPHPTRKTGRVIDNQEAAKSWMAFIGFSDQAGDRVTHFFSDNTMYDRAFASRPSIDYWKAFATTLDWDTGREDLLEPTQGDVSQYLLAYFIWKYVNAFVPSPSRYREIALDQGVIAGKLKKSSGSYVSSEKDQADYLSTNETYQTWRLLANMKELACEVISQILTRKYGPLTPNTCYGLLHNFEARDFLVTGDAKEAAVLAASAKDFEEHQVFGRTLSMLKFVAEQFWENRKQQLLSTSRLRTYLLRRDVAAAFKQLVWEYADRKNLDKSWKAQGHTFVESLPQI